MAAETAMRGGMERWSRRMALAAAGETGAAIVAILACRAGGVLRSMPAVVTIAIGGELARVEARGLAGRGRGGWR